MRASAGTAEGFVRRAAAARRRSWRVLAVFLAGSAALHAALLAALPPSLFRARDSAKAGALEVVILKPEPLPVAPPQAPPPQARREPEPAATRIPVKPGLSPQAAATPPLPEPPRVPDAAVGPPPGASRAVPTGPNADLAAAAVAPPGLDAAYLRNPPPRYPLAARRAGEQGTVTLRVLVTREGLPSRVDVEKSSGSPYLDTAALEAVKAWRFTPARRGAEPIESWVLVPIVFRLEGTS